MSTAAEQNQDAVAIASELPPPAEPVRKDKRWRKHPRPGALTKRPPPRPHKRVPTDVLQERVKKLTARMERAKKQVPHRLFLADSIIMPRLTRDAPRSTRTRADSSPSTRTRRRTGCASRSRRRTRPRQRPQHLSPSLRRLPRQGSRLHRRLPLRDPPTCIYATPSLGEPGVIHHHYAKNGWHVCCSRPTRLCPSV